MHEEARRLHIQLLAAVLAGLDQVSAALIALSRRWPRGGASPRLRSASAIVPRLSASTVRLPAARRTCPGAGGEGTSTRRRRPRTLA